MPRKKAAKPFKPPLAAICGAFAAGHEVRLTAKGPLREPRHFTERDFAVAASIMGVRKARTAAETLQWLRARGLVYQRGPKDAFVLTSKGARVTDRACQVFSRRSGTRR